jgi:hypothetical protein
MRRGQSLLQPELAVQESQCTIDAQTLAKAYIAGGEPAYHLRHTDLMKVRKIKAFEHAILMERVRNILVNNGIILRRSS